MDITLQHPCPGCPAALKHCAERTLFTTGNLPRAASASSLPGSREDRKPGLHIRSTSRGHRPWHTESLGTLVDWDSTHAKRQMMVAFSRLDKDQNGFLEQWEMDRYLKKQYPKKT